MMKSCNRIILFFLTLVLTQAPSTLFAQPTWNSISGPPLDILHTNPLGTRVGIGVSNPKNALDVTSNAVIGEGFAGIFSAPKNGLLVQGNVGIGTNNPLGRLHVSGGSVLFDGTVGATPASGAGTRLMFVPAKAAFRAGIVSGIEWDDANIGTGSAAFGGNNTVSGLYSLGSGYSNYVTGGYSSALGFSNNVSGAFSFAASNNNNVSGSTSTALGYRHNVSGDYSTAGGSANVVSGNFATAFGSSNTAAGNNAVVLGFVNSANGLNSFAAGNEADGAGDYSVAIGRYVEATAINAFVFGKGCNTSFPLENDIANSLMVGFGSTVPTLFVGPSVGLCPLVGQLAEDFSAEQSHELRQNCGKVGICTSAPTHSLHVNGDARISKNLRIGTNDRCAGDIHADYTLAVDGKTVTRSLIVTVNGWCDFVFDDDYALTPLNELEKSIKANRHLPGIPTEAEVMENGVSVGEMQASLLLKVEELTLYIIEQNKKVEALQNRVHELEARK